MWCSASYLLEPHREEAIERAIATFDFDTHDFSDDELMHAGFLMLTHALQMPELETWRLPDGMLLAGTWISIN